MSARIGTIKGKFLVPGVSKNHRLYKGGPDGNITKAVARMQERLADPQGAPITMLTHHGAGDDSTRIAARVTKVALAADGGATWEADIAPTAAGRDIAALTTPEKPYLANVSLRGWWLGDVSSENVDGVACDTAADLEIDGIDFTKTPGVTAARIDSATLAETTGGLARTAISESLEEAQVTVITEELVDAEVARLAEAAKKDPKKPYGDVAYADPGYQSDGVSRYPLDTKAHVRAGWAYINQADNAKPYSAAQLKRIKGRIKAAAKKAGIDIAAETQALNAAVTEALEEAWASMRVDNGAATVDVQGWINDPAFLAAVGKKVALAALAGIAILDPDNDGDIDLSPADVEATDDDDMESQTSEGASASTANTDGQEAKMTTSATTAVVPAKKSAEELAAMSPEELGKYAAQFVAPPEPEAGKGTTTETAPAAGTTEGDKPKPADATTTTETAAGDRNLTDADIAALAAAIKPTTEAAPADATTTESAPSITQEAFDKALKDQREEILGEVGKTIGRAGIRKGLVNTESSAPDKPLHEMSDDELREYGKQTIGTLVTDH